MNSELLNMRGRIAVNTKALETLALGIDVDISEARCLLDKFAEKSELDPDRIEVVSGRIVESLRKYRHLHSQTKQMQKEIGE